MLLVQFTIKSLNNTCVEHVLLKIKALNDNYIVECFLFSCITTIYMRALMRAAKKHHIDPKLAQAEIDELIKLSSNNVPINGIV